MLENFGDSITNFVCPNITEYSLLEPNWLDFDKSYHSILNFHVEIRDSKAAASVALAKNTYILSAYMYPFYSPETYRENGGYLVWSNDVTRYSYYDATGSVP